MSVLGSVPRSFDMPGVYPSGAYSVGHSAYSGQVARVSGGSTASSGLTAFGSGRVGLAGAELTGAPAVEPSGGSFGSSPLAVSPRTGGVQRPGARRLPLASAQTLPPTAEEEEVFPTAS